MSNFIYVNIYQCLLIIRWAMGLTLILKILIQNLRIKIVHLESGMAFIFFQLGFGTSKSKDEQSPESLQKISEGVYNTYL